MVLRTDTDLTIGSTDRDNPIGLDERFFSELDSVTESVVKPIVRRKLRTTLRDDDTRERNQDAIELVGDIQVMLLAAGSSQGENGAEPIRDLTGYAARTASNACYLYFRNKFPKRTSQENKLRYALKNMDGVDLWRTDDGVWLCGRAVDRGRDRSVVQALDPTIGDRWMDLDTRDGYLNAVRSIVDGSPGPVRFDEVVDLLMDKLGIRDAATVSTDEIGSGGEPSLADPNWHDTRFDAADHSQRLKKLWRDLLTFSVRERKVLLLNLKHKGRDLLRVLPVCGVASIEEIAAALEFDLEELPGLMLTLPWDDHKLAEHLGLRRQQVINLRHYVRSKLVKASVK